MKGVIQHGVMSAIESAKPLLKAVNPPFSRASCKSDFAKASADGFYGGGHGGPPHRSLA